MHTVLKKSGGRNHRGRITIHHNGGRHKRLYRQLDYFNKGYRFILSGTVNKIEYDPNRTANIGVCENGNRKFYTLLGTMGEIKVLKLKDVIVGDEVYNVSNRAGQCGKYGRSTGTKLKVLKQGAKETIVRMPSRQIKALNNQNTCILGGVTGKPRDVIQKAGRNR